MAIERRPIEEKLLMLAQNVDTTEADWPECEAFTNFLNTWRDLAHYYEENLDATLDERVLKVYMRYAVALRRIAENETNAPYCQPAKDALADLNSRLDGVFRRLDRSRSAGV